MTDQGQYKVSIPSLAALLAKAKHFPDGFDPGLAKHGGSAGKVESAVQEKKWGWELWLVYTDKYALKILHVNKGGRLSLQRHSQKQESWVVLAGEPELTVTQDKVAAYSAGDVLHIPPGTVHRIAAPSGDVEILEVSTPELSDLERLEDDYGRK
jgi:mannose-6-phosphate isomerase